MAADRLFLESDWSYEEGLTASIATDDMDEADLERFPVCIAVAAVHAMDSYNETFTSSVHLTVEQAAQLRDWLSAAIAARA